MTPEDDRLADSAEFEQHERPPTEVVMTSEELAFLSTADVDDPKVQDWLKKHDVSLGGSFVAHIEGLPDTVFLATEDDFGTRDKAATEQWQDALLSGEAPVVVDSEANEFDVEASIENASRAVVAIDASIDRHSAEIAAEVEPQFSEEELRKVGDKTAEEAGVNDPSEDEPSPIVDLMSGNTSGPLKFDMEAAKAKIEQDNLERLMPTEEMSQVQGALSEIFRQYTFKYDMPGPDSQAFEAQMPHNLFSEATSALTRLEKGYAGKEAVSFELGALMAGVKDPHAAEAIMKQVEQSGLYSDDEVKALDEQIAKIVIQNGYAGTEGPHFHSVLSHLQTEGNQTFSTDAHVDSVRLALLGASVGVYARIGTIDGLHQGQRRLSEVMAELYKMKK